MRRFPIPRPLSVAYALDTESHRTGELQAPRPMPWRGHVDGASPGDSLSVSVVIPALNEARNIGSVLRRIPTYVNEVVLVDGGSVDGTVEEAMRHRPDAVVLHQQRRGKGLALRTGFRAATCDVIVMLDADGSMAPEEIGRFLFLLAEGYQLVKGSRFLIGGGSADLTRLRRLGNLGLRSLVNLRYGATMTDLCYGYCAFFRRDLKALELNADGFEIETEIVTNAMRAGLRITEVPSFERSRLSGRSNLRPIRDGERILQLLMVDRSHTSRRASRAGAAARDESIFVNGATERV